MKSNLKNLFFLITAVITLTLAAPTASAINLYWDTNGTGTVGSGAATGNWGLDASWSTDSTGLNVGPVTLTAITTGVDDLFFSAGTNGTGGTVTVNTSRTAKSITFEEGAITLSGSTLITLAGGGGITVVAAPGTSNATISTALTINGNNTFNVGSGSTLTLDTGAFTRGTRATLNVQGAGTVSSTMAGLNANTNNILGPWASFGAGSATTYVKYPTSGSTIGGLGYTGGVDGVNALLVSTNVVTGAGNLNYTLGAAGTLGTSAAINTLRYTGAAGTLATDTSFTTLGIMNSGTGLLTFSGAVTSGAAATELVVNTANANITFDGTITGTIVKTGSGTLTMGSGVTNALANQSNMTVNEGILITNSLTNDVLRGATINSGGTVRWGAGSKIDNGQEYIINAGGTLDIQGFTDLINKFNGAGTITGTTGLLQVQGGVSVFTGLISGSGLRLNLQKDGAATVTLSGLNTYGGTTTIQRGTLNINSIGLVNGAASAIGTPTSAANGLIAMGFEGVTGTLVYTGTGHITDRQIRIGTNAATPLVTDTGGATITANGASNTALTFNATTFNTQTNALTGTSPTRTLTLQGTSTGLNTISGIIQNNQIASVSNAAVAVTKAQAGTWVLSGNNTYTGGTGLGAGMLQFTKLLAMPATGAVAVTGGTLAVNVGGAGEWSTATSGVGTIGGLLAGSGGQGSSTVTYAGTVALGFDTSSNGNQTYAGVIANVGTTLGITKLGANTLALSNANTYTGATTISAGTLQLTGGGRLNNGSYAGALAIASGATFEQGAAVTQTLSGVVGTGGGNVSLTNGSGQLILQNTSNAYGALNISAGRVFIQTNAGALPTAATVALTGGTLDFDVAGSPTFTNAITVSSGTTNIAARRATTLTNVTLPGSGFVTFNNDDAATSTLAITSNQTLSGTLSIQVGGNAAPGVVTLSGDILGGGGAITKIGTGTLVLSGTNSYGGLTTVTGGALNIGSAGSLNSGNALTVGASGTADFQNVGQTLGAVSNANTATNALNFSNSSGTVVLASLTGVGNTRFGSNGTVTGGISTGTVTSVGALNADISGGTVTAGGLLTGTISGAGTVGADSLSSTSVTGGTNTITGAASITTLNGGGTTVGGVATIGTMTSGTANLNGATSSIGTLNGGTINLGTTTLTISDGSSSGSITGVNGALTKATGGTLTLSGNNSYGGTTLVNAGSMLVNGSLDVASAVSVGASGTLGGSGTVNGTLALTGTLAPGGAGVDIKTLNAGTTTWNGGSIWNFDLSSVDNTSDKLAITGNLVQGTGTLGTDYVFNFMGSQPVWNTTYTLATFASFTGFTDGFNFTATNLGSGSYSTSYFTLNGTSLTFTAVPEPTSALAGLLIGAGLLRRRRN